MNLNTYQEEARKTAIYPGQNECTPIPADRTGNWRTGAGLIYCCLKLSGEVGEFNEKIGKAIRDKFGAISPELRLELAKELGDIFWYIANASAELDLNLTQIAEMNLEKLRSRQSRGTLSGSGDNR